MIKTITHDTSTLCTITGLHITRHNMKASPYNIAYNQRFASVQAFIHTRFENSRVDFCTMKILRVQDWVGAPKRNMGYENLRMLRLSMTRRLLLQFL